MSDDTTMYAQARDRVDASDLLRPYRSIILDTNWSEPEHWPWVVNADEAQILSWAKQIADNLPDAA